MILKRRIKGYKGTLKDRARQLFYKWLISESDPISLQKIDENNSIIKRLNKLPNQRYFTLSKPMKFRRFLTKEELVKE